MKRSYQRHLPHQIPGGAVIFLTWCLKGAVPRRMIEILRRERTRLEQQPAKIDESPGHQNLRASKLLFAMADRELDSAADGPTHLKDPAAAKTVEDSILFGTPKRYDLYSWCVMVNHVHVLFKPHEELSKITQGLKGFTAREINAQQNARGRSLWQDESYDHWARNEEEVLRIIEYVENNPVAAGLCQSPANYLWSSARRHNNWPKGTPFVGQAFQPDESKS